VSTPIRALRKIRHVGVPRSTRYSSIVKFARVQHLRRMCQMERWRVRRLADPVEIAAFLEQDRWYAAYAIGDLEPDLFEQCHWFGADLGGQLRSLALLFEGLDPPALFLMGEPMEGR